MYATADDLEARMKREYAAIYTDDTTEEIDTTLVEADIAAAQAEVDGKIGNRYTVPVTAETALALLQDWTLTLAQGKAYSRSASSKRPEKLEKDIEDVKKSLADVIAGSFKLIGATETSQGNGSASLIDIDEPVFTREKMEGF